MHLKTFAVFLTVCIAQDLANGQIIKKLTGVKNDIQLQQEDVISTGTIFIQIERLLMDLTKQNLQEALHNCYYKENPLGLVAFQLTRCGETIAEIGTGGECETKIRDAGTSIKEVATFFLQFLDKVKHNTGNLNWEIGHLATKAGLKFADAEGCKWMHNENPTSDDLRDCKSGLDQAHIGLQQLPDQKCLEITKQTSIASKSQDQLEIYQLVSWISYWLKAISPVVSKCTEAKTAISNLSEKWTTCQADITEAGKIHGDNLQCQETIRDLSQNFASAGNSLNQYINDINNFEKPALDTWYKNAFETAAEIMAGVEKFNSICSEETKKSVSDSITKCQGNISNLVVNVVQSVEKCQSNSSRK